MSHSVTRGTAAIPVKKHLPAVEIDDDGKKVLRGEFRTDAHIPDPAAAQKLGKEPLQHGQELQRELTGATIAVECVLADGRKAKVPFARVEAVSGERVEWQSVGPYEIV